VVLLLRRAQRWLELANLSRAIFGNLGLVALVYGLLLLAVFGPGSEETALLGFGTLLPTPSVNLPQWGRCRFPALPMVGSLLISYPNPLGDAELHSRQELLMVYAELENTNGSLPQLGLALLTALLLLSYGQLLSATRPVTAIFAFLAYVLALLPPFFILDGDYLGAIHLLVYPGAILIFFSFASLTTDQRGS
jgi:hypothetical protein